MQRQARYTSPITPEVLSRSIETAQALRALRTRTVLVAPGTLRLTGTRTSFLRTRVNGSLANTNKGTNSIFLHCLVGQPYTLPRGLAIDSAGDVFVGVNFFGSNQGGQLEEFQGGLTNCKFISLIGSPPIGGADGLLFDKSQNLLLADSRWVYSIPPGVDVIAPPYKSISQRYTGFTPRMMALNKRQNLLYGSESRGSAKQIQVLTYPGGKLVTTLGSS
jgi:hypothetical protein